MAHMEATILDTNFDIIGIVDDYQSMIWTERYSQTGDFEIYGDVSTTVGIYPKMGYFVTIPESNRAMIIENMEVNETAKDGNRMVVSGRSLESILMRRIIWDQTIFSGGVAVQDIIEQLLNDNVIVCTGHEERIIPNLIFLASEDPAVLECEVESAQFTGQTVYEAVQQLCEAFDLGFKIELVNKFLIFSLFAGKDRSYSQSDNAFVVYSDDFDNVISSVFKNSMAGYSNIALVAGEGEGSDRRKATYTTQETEPSGLQRYEMFVDARDISSTTDSGTIPDSDYIAMLQTRGAEKLAEVEEDYTYDAQIDMVNSYQYGIDYDIGDILQHVGVLGINAQIRITEFIRCMDTSGYSAYPQFKIIDLN